MRIRLLRAMAGAWGARGVGDVVDVDAAEGARLVEAGYAEPVRQAPVETRPRRGGEKAVSR